MTPKYDCIIGNCANFYISDLITKVEETVEIDASEKNNSVEKLQDKEFNNFLNLEKLFLADCNITEVSATAFTGLSKLKELNLTKNKIQHLDGDTFKNLSSLTTLYLAQNQIQKIDGNLFRYNLKLETLSLASNQIYSIGRSAFENLTRLNSLDFSNNPCAHYSCQNCSSNLIETHQSLAICYRSYQLKRHSYTLGDSLDGPAVIVIMIFAYFWVQQQQNQP
jgi:Leucine-rich repeat (LRR) protein